MPQLFVKTRDGEVRTIKARVGLSVMENIRDNGIDELLALCGGCLSCATCHVYVEERFASVLDQPGDDERELLESSESRGPGSRLACQIPVTEALEGLRVSIAPED